MKTLSIWLSAMVLLGSAAYAQESDDMYFTKSDRKKEMAEKSANKKTINTANQQQSVETVQKQQTQEKTSKFANPDVASPAQIANGNSQSSNYSPVYNYDASPAANASISSTPPSYYNQGTPSWNTPYYGGWTSCSAYNAWNRPRMIMGWSPQWGWSTSIMYGSYWGGGYGSYGYNPYGYNPYYSNYYGYNPYYSNYYGYNPWYNPYYYNNPVVVVDNRNTVVHNGPRPSLHRGTQTSTNQVQNAYRSRIAQQVQGANSSGQRVSTSNSTQSVIRNNNSTRASSPVRVNTGNSNTNNRTQSPIRFNTGSHSSGGGRSNPSFSTPTHSPSRSGGGGGVSGGGRRGH